MRIEPHEMITARSYYCLCDYVYNSEMVELPSGIVGCDIGAIPEFFKRIENNGHNYVVVSPRSDYGLYYQETSPVWADTYKAVQMLVGPEYNYRPVTIPTRCDIDNCSPEDKYSIKCYMHTKATFDKVPDNVVKWFLSNCSIMDNPKLVQIPFGLYDDPDLEKRTKLYNAYTEQKLDKHYINFQFYTNERLELYHHFEQRAKGNDSFLVKQNVPFDEYIEDISTIKYIVSPFGNGIDCYRILEALYVGSIPIIQTHNGLFYLWANSITHAACLDLRQLPIVSYLIKNGNYEPLKLSYWKRKINDVKI